MDNSDPDKIQQPVPVGGSQHQRLTPGLVLFFTLAIFWGAILLTSIQLRTWLKDRILNRDGEVINAIALLQTSAEDLTSSTSTITTGDDLLDHLSIALEATKSKDVLAVRFYNEAGHFLTAFPPNTSEAPSISEKNRTRLQRGETISQMIESVPLSALFRDQPTNHTPVLMDLLTVYIPLCPKASAVPSTLVEFILDGSKVKQEIKALDYSLIRYGLAVGISGALVLITVIVLGFRKLEQTNRLLAERSASLLKANHELSMAAKMSAIGAVSAHLLHGIKNPLSGLQSFVNSHLSENTADEDWKDAAATASRMQAQVNQIAQILREESNPIAYEINLEELADILRSRIKASADKKNVKLSFHTSGNRNLSNRDANLVLLILENLVQNAIDATRSGLMVSIHASASAQKTFFTVSDQGLGIPSDIQKHLFSPCPSSKPGGSGIGLALSRQLAASLNATLELAKSTPGGSQFDLTLPLSNP